MNTVLKRIADIEEKPHPKFPNVFIKLLANNSETDRLSSLYVRIMPGAELAPHVHDVLEFFHIVKGHGHALVKGERVEVFGGEVIIAPIGEEHGLKNAGETDLELMVVYSPGLA